MTSSTWGPIGTTRRTTTRSSASRPGAGWSPIRGSLGIVIGGSGNGEQIAANKVTGIRAVLAWNTETASLARQHNNANVVAIGARMHDEETAAGLVDTFLTTDFSHGERHLRRISELTAYDDPEPPFLPS